MLQDEGDPLLFGMREDDFPGVEAVFDGFVAVHAVKLHAGEGDDFFAADSGGDVDGFVELGDDFIAEFGIAGTVGETVAGSERDVEAECFDVSVVFAVDAFDADDADVFGVLGQHQRIHGVEAPAHDAVFDAMVFDDVGRICGGFVDGLGAET